MCLILPKKSSKPKIAKEDIYCLKLVKDYDPSTKKCISYYQQLDQKVGEMMESEIVRESELIENGLHAIQLNLNFSCYLRRNATLMLAMIPKGSEYYLGLRGDIVANRMVLIEPLVTNQDFLEVAIPETHSKCLYETGSNLRCHDMLVIANQILAIEGYDIRNKKFSPSVDFDTFISKRQYRSFDFFLP